jgi:hypothetical protein
MPRQQLIGRLAVRPKALLVMIGDSRRYLPPPLALAKVTDGNS